jgi:CRISPR-associated protein Csd1
VILQALNELAQRERLVEDPDYELKPVRWLLTLNARGEPAGPLRCTNDAEGNAQKYAVPRQPKRTSGANAFFLCDNAQFAFGVTTPDKPDAKPEYVRRCFDAFRREIEECAAQTGDAGINAVRTFLAGVALSGFPFPLPEALKSNDQFGFVLDSDLDLLISERPAVREYWRRKRAAPGQRKPIMCLITGREDQHSGVHPAVKKLPGANPAGAALISYNKPAFWSYGWPEHENATISRAASESFSAALNRLLDPQPPNPADPGTTLPRRNLRLTTDTVVCFWASDRSADGFLDVFDALLNANPETVGEMYRCVWRGQPVNIGDASRFYALNLSGAQGRAIVRSWIETSVAEVSGHLARHFEDLSLEPLTQPKKGTRQKNSWVSSGSGSLPSE